MGCAPPDPKASEGICHEMEVVHGVSAMSWASGLQGRRLRPCVSITEALEPHPGHTCVTWGVPEGRLREEGTAELGS